MEAVIFRPVTAEELPAVWALWHACADVGNCPWNDDYPTRDILQLDWKNGWLYALFQSDTLVGSASLMQTDDLEKLGFPFQETESIAVLTRLCVTPTLQKRGNGRKLVEQVHLHAISNGIRAIHLLCDVRNENALALYRRAGYRDVCNADLYGDHFTVMEKLLS